MITFKQYIAEQEDKATPGFDKDKDGNVFVAHDTSFDRKKEKEKKKDTNESIIKKVKKAFGVKADHEKSLADHAASHNKTDHSEHLSNHSSRAHDDNHESEAFGHFKRNSSEMNEHLISQHKKGLRPDHHKGYSKKAAHEHKIHKMDHSHWDDHSEFPDRHEQKHIRNSEAHVHHTIHKHSKPLGKKITLYHGSHHDFGAAAAKHPKGIIHNPAHMSTSHDHKSAKEFGSGHILAIHADKKTKAVHIDGEGARQQSNHPEKETVLPAGTKLKHVKSHKTSDGYTVHHFKVHSQHDNGKHYDH